MDARVNLQEYPTYKLHPRAIDTVARFAGVEVSDVLFALERRIRRHQRVTMESSGSVGTRHRNAVETVARYAGMSPAVVMYALEHYIDAVRSSAPHSYRRVA